MLARKRWTLGIRGEVRDHRVGDLDADDTREFLARRSPNAGQTSERGQQGLPPPQADPGHDVELRLQIALPARLAMEGDRKAMRLVANALQQPQRVAVRIERERLDRCRA